MLNPFQYVWDKFGFEVKKDPETVEAIAVTIPQSVVPPENDTGAFVVDNMRQMTSYNQSHPEQSLQSDAELIRTYRSVAMLPEADQAITQICNQAIVIEDNTPPVSIDTDNLKDVSSKTKSLIQQEFNTILKLTNFNQRGWDIFRQWYIDGRLYHQLLIDINNPYLGILEVRYISPYTIKPITELYRDQVQTKIGTIQLINKTDQYFFYTNEILKTRGQALKFAKDSICYINSGLFDEPYGIDGINQGQRRVIGYLHKAIKPANNLKAVEDAAIIYILTRAPERRVFYIDVAGLPKAKAEEYMKSIANKFRSKMVYDTNTGKMKDQTAVTAMMEDYWLPRRDGKSTTEISTLKGGDSLDDIENQINYFLRKFYKALGIPASRIDQEGGGMFTMGRVGEISRDEVDYAKLIRRLQTQFSEFFMILLRVQLVLKGIIKEHEWDDLKHQLSFNFVSDSEFAELKDNEILTGRFNLMMQANDYVGTYISKDYVWRTLMRMSDDEIDAQKKKIQKELDTGEIHPDAGIAPGQPGIEAQQAYDQNDAQFGQDQAEHDWPEPEPEQQDNKKS